MIETLLTRRQFTAGAAVALAAPSLIHAEEKSKKKFRLNYILGSPMYGYTSLAEIAPEVKKTGATAIDIWPKVHGNQREQLAEMGEEKFAALLKQHGVSLGCITQYKLGPIGLRDEMKLAQQLGCQTAKPWSPAGAGRWGSRAAN